MPIVEAVPIVLQAPCPHDSACSASRQPAPGSPLVPQPPQIGARAESATAEARGRPGAAGDHQRWQVGAGRAHQGPGNRLIAVGEQDESVHRVAARHLLDLDGEEVAVKHGGRHHEVFAERDHGELHRNAAGRTDPGPHGRQQVA
jgi:hypothetical protein